MMALVVWATHAASLAPGDSKLARLELVGQRIDSLVTGAHEAEVLRIAFLGDSTVDPPRSPENSLPAQLELGLEHWQHDGPPVVVYSMAAAALSSVTYHFLTPDIIAAQPDLVVWQLAFTHTSEHWLSGFTHHEFAGRLSFAELLPLLRLPIHELGLSADDLLLYKLLMRPGLRSAWSWLVQEQSRVQKTRDELDNRIYGQGANPPVRLFRGLGALKRQKRTMEFVDGRSRYLGKRAIIHQGEGLKGVQPDHVTLRLLAESLALYAEAGIPVVAYLSPINIEHLRAVGVVDEDRLSLSLESYRSVVASHGASFVDLHDLLPDDSFFDARGHFHRTEAFDTPGQIVDKLLPAVTGGLDGLVEQRRGAPSRVAPSRQEGRLFDGPKGQ
jgi:hypothetical protein